MKELSNFDLLKPYLVLLRVFHLQLLELEKLENPREERLKEKKELIVGISRQMFSVIKDDDLL